MPLAQHCIGESAVAVAVFRRTRLLTVWAATALLVAACSSDGGVSTTTAPPASTTTSGAPASTTSTSPDTTTTSAVTTIPDTNALAEGSGCTPGTTEGLPDGEWFGSVQDATPDSLVFDLACWFTGEAAAQAAAEDGAESPPPNDYYVRNTNPATRTLTVADGAEVTWMPNPGDPTTEETVDYPQWLEGRTARPYQPGVWLTITGGAVVDVREQYVP